MKFVSKISSPLIILIINALGSLFALLVEFFLARGMDAPDYGSFRYLYTVCIIASTAIMFGGSQRVIRGVARYGTSSRTSKEVSASLALSFLAFLVLSPVLLFWIWGRHQIGLSLAIGLLAWIVARTLFLTYRSINVGAGNYYVAQLSDRLVLNGVPALIFAASLALGFGITLHFSLIASLIGTISALAISLLIVAWKGGIGLCTVNLFDLRNRFSDGLYIALADGADVFVRTGAILVVSPWLSLSEIAVLALVIRLVDALGLIQSAATAAYSRPIIRSIKESSMSDVRLSVNRYSAFCGFFVFVALLVTIVAGEFIIGIFGGFYSNYGYALTLGVLALLVRQLVGPWQIVLVATNNSRIMFFVNLFFSVALIALCSILSWKFGFKGALVGHLATIALHSITQSFVCYSVSGIYPGIAINRLESA